MKFDSIEDIKKLEYVGNGKYGCVYKLDDITAIKVYIETGYYDIGEVKIFKIPNRKFKLLKKKQSKIQNTSLVQEQVFVEDEVVGVTLKYVDGDILQDIKPHLNRRQRKDVCYELIENAEELTRNGIYPMDYKLTNVMYSKKGKVEIIDLDDPLTHVKRNNHSFLKHGSIDALKYTIKDFLKENEEENMTVADFELVKKVFPSYNDLREYVKKR